MNIKEHIDAGHYPKKDEKGRPLVPMQNGCKATICTTDGPEGKEIIGWYKWLADDKNVWICAFSKTGENRLLPPPPRKAKITRWGGAGGSAPRHVYSQTYLTREEAVSAFGEENIIEFTGECEEPWRE